MKRRSSFVANSSSSSFLILGNREELKIDDFPEVQKVWDIADAHSKNTGLDVLEIDEDYEEFYVGAVIFDDRSGSIGIETFEARILAAKKKLEEKGITNYSVHFGERNY